MAAKANRFSVELPNDLSEAVSRMASAREQSSEEFIEQAVRAYIEDENAFLAAIDEAVAEADKGVFVSGEKVEAWLRSWGTDRELPMPEPDIFPDTHS
jgi:predicted transcriptional regulator